jgi:MFS family permease
MPRFGPSPSRKAAAAQAATAASVTRTYYALQALFTLAASIIWGVNTLFLLDAGLNLFWVFAVNATFSAGQIIFEVPTGVIADTIGRRASFLIGIAALVISTLGYVASAVLDWGLAGFILFSVLLGFGFTCQTGAVDAWLVDALDATGYSGRKDRVFARMGIFTGVAMLVGTVGGGLLGQLDLAIPYYVRAGLLVGVFAVTSAFMHDIGFKPRALEISRFGEESRRIFGEGVRYGWRHPVVNPLLFTSFVSGFVTWYFFYASQPYALDLLGKGNLVWVAGIVTALYAVSGIAGNSLVGPISRSRWGKRPATVLFWGALGSAALTVVLGVLGLVTNGGSVPAFAVFVALMVGSGLLYGIMVPIRQAYINENIPSAQRATVLSFDAFFSDVGAVAGQVGLGYAAQAVSKALAYTIGGVIYFVSAPLYRRAGRSSDRLAAEGITPEFAAAAGDGSAGADPEDARESAAPEEADPAEAAVGRSGEAADGSGDAATREPGSAASSLSGGSSPRREDGL